METSNDNAVLKLPDEIRLAKAKSVISQTVINQLTENDLPVSLAPFLIKSVLLDIVEGQLINISNAISTD